MNYEKNCNHCGKEILALRGDRCPLCGGIIGETQKEAKARLENTKAMRKPAGNASSKFERLLFGGLRFYTMFSVVAALFCIVRGVFVYFSPIYTQVELREISNKASISPKLEVPYEKPLIYTKRVRKYIPEGGDKDTLLISWLSKIEADQKQDFIDNLSEIIYQAERDKLDVSESINYYKELKFKKITKSGSVKSSQNLTATLLITSSILSLLISGLILVALAIERHLRPPLRVIDSEGAVL